MTWNSILSTFGVAILSGFAYLGTIFYQHRSKMNELRKQGVPMPKEWSWLTGHLLVLQKYADKLPPDANVNLATALLAKEFPESEAFLLDLWPVYPPLFFVWSPEIAVQVSTKLNLPRTAITSKFMRPITGGESLLSMNDEDWKIWRSLLNPGFSTQSMMDNVPHIVDKVQIFTEKLRRNVGHGVFQLDDLTTRLTMDVIIKVVLGVDLNYQRSENVLATSLGYITRWHSFWDPRILLHPLRPLVQKYHGHLMNEYIYKKLDERFLELKSEKLSSKTTSRSKSVTTLALEGYIGANSSRDITSETKLDEHFAKYASHQIRLFLFAGNDTTSSTIVFVYHLLSKHPEALAKIREEHDSVFGPISSEAATLLKQKPALLNQCHYTMAVIKETLRLYPPASTMRRGGAGIVVTDRHNNSYPLDHINVTIAHPPCHRNPRLWPHPDKFIPERFLVDQGHELYPNPASYRPFEQGPRNCIGQTLVFNEIRIVVVLTARVFDIRDAYEENDAAKLRSQSWLAKMGEMIGVTQKPIKEVNNERAYQTEKAGGHPADGYPCRVTLAEGS